MYKLVQLLAHKVCVYERLCSMATTVDLGNVIGPQGPQGVQGVQGPKGPKGDTGPAGANWYVLDIGYDIMTDTLVARYETDVIDAFNYYPYIVCIVNYDHLLEMFVPTARYRLWDDSKDNYAYYIQFSCLTLKDTANDAHMRIASYFNCVVICDDGTVTGSVRDVDPAVDWSNIANRPFNSISNDVFSVDENGTVSIKCATVIANCLQYPSNGFMATQYNPEQDTFTLDFAPAGEYQPGIVKVGSGLNVTDDGTISCDAVTKNYVDECTSPQLALGVLYTNGAALNTQKTYVGFPNITIRTSTYDTLYKYIVTQSRVVESVIFYVPKVTTGQNASFLPHAIQTFQVSHFKRTVVNGVLNFSIVADCFINDGIVQNASSTMLNLGRITLSMNSKTTILMEISSSSAMSLASSENLYLPMLTFSKSTT